ncbi:MAG: PrsW family intramembrane metalloprotease [Lachnospiraceae bacterium]|nr:PrsW family intramembrane metalloprotease [Lachnospiraceae bacterium]
MIYSENILICIALPLLIALLFTKSDTRRFISFFVTGMAVCLLSAYLSGFFKYLMKIETEEMAVFYSPIVEEIMKVLPLLFYVFVFEPKPGKLFTAGIGMGLGFATFENCCYILSSGASNISYIMVRGLAVGVMHLVCGLVLVIGLNTAIFFNVLSLPVVVGAISLSTVFHGLYNLLVSGGELSSNLGYAFPVIMALLLFVPCRRLLDHYNSTV